MFDYRSVMVGWVYPQFLGSLIDPGIYEKIFWWMIGRYKFKIDRWDYKVADLSPKHLRKQAKPQMVQSAGSKYWCFTRVWRLHSGPNLLTLIPFLPSSWFNGKWVISDIIFLSIWVDWNPLNHDYGRILHFAGNDHMGPTWGKGTSSTQKCRQT